MRRTILGSTTFSGLVLLTALAVPFSTALAQDEALEEITVTGSRIGTSDMTSISPMTSLSEEDLRLSGHSTLEDFLQNVPSVGQGDFGSTVNNGNPGLASVSLRGLGPTRTLVLVDGNRLAAAGTNGFVDLNVVPSAMVERIEVLRDGASTIYGSDAIGGVINIITKKNFEGAAIDFQMDQTSEGDGNMYSASLVIGGGNDRGNVMVGAQVTDRELIRQGDRGFSASALGEEIDPVTGNINIVPFGSGTAYPGHLFGTATCGVDPVTGAPISCPETALSSGWVVDAGTGLARPFTSSDSFNFAASSIMVTPQKVISAFGSGSYDLIEDGGVTSVSANVSANFANRQSKQLLAPVGTFWGPVVPATNPNNPFGNALCASDPNCSQPQGVVVTRRLRETDGRGFNQDVNSWRISTGLEGVMANEWTWQANYTYAHWSDAQADEGRINTPRGDALLDPALCAADTACPGVWNPFAIDTLTPEMMAYALVNPNTIENSTMTVAQLNVQGDFGGWELPGGLVEWGLGFEHRTEDATSFPDAAALLGQILFVVGEVTTGAYKVDEVYAEVRLPLLDSVNIDLSARSSDYDFVPDKSTVGKFGIDWAPLDAVRFRATYAEGFRAPNISELAQPETKTAAGYNDPCSNYTAASVSAVVFANCVSEGLPSDGSFTLSSQQATGLVGGNQNLEPEESESVTFGVVFTPGFAEGLSITLDYYDVQIDKAIGSAGTDNVVTGCYNSANFSSPFCAFIEGAARVDESPHATSPFRNALGNISGTILTNQNLSTFETSGIDFDIQYVFDLNVGTIDLQLWGTYLNEFNFQSDPGSPSIQYVGKFGTDPYQSDVPAAFSEYKSNFRVGYTRDNWGASWITRYLSETTDLNATPANADNIADSIAYHDIQGFFRFNDMTFTLGIRNVTDEDPPYMTNNHDMNTLPFSYDTAGTYFYARAGIVF
jgi:iron complex outermembrane receptor protein